MTLAELPEDFTPQQFMLLDRESLDQIPYEIKKWQCQCKGCTNGTKVRDYGISPYFWIHRNSKFSQTNPQEYWDDLRKHIWICGKHQKFKKRLLKRFTWEEIYARLMDPCEPLDKLVPIACN